MHPISRRVPERLGHKRGMKAVFLGQGLDRKLERHDIVGSGKGIRIFQINLMLPCGGLMVAGLHRDPHFLQR